MLVREGNKIIVNSRDRACEFLGFSKKEKFSKIGELMYQLKVMSRVMYGGGKVSFPLPTTHKDISLDCDDARSIKEGDIKKAQDIWNTICKKAKDLFGSPKMYFLDEIKPDIKGLQDGLKKRDPESLDPGNDPSEYRGAMLIDEDSADEYCLYFIFDQKIYGMISYVKDKIKKWCKENDVPYRDINIQRK